ncbi:MAG: DUF2252 family protein [Parasulfuritortus sp.]|jgi:uncharacterized protein (DUF2252 family)|nr:DUF2252 family protein [Parasulfuritortus sp.]
MVTKSDPVDSLIQHDAGRAPDLLAMKYAKMATDPFVFLRGACNLFYDALPSDPLFSKPPLVWACGDLHFENFGSYKGDDRLVYFDVNDFDEAALAPCTWDLVRLLTSVLCGAGVLGSTEDVAIEACRSMIQAYREALLRGKPLWVERDNVEGPIADLLDGLKQRKREDFLDQRTIKHKGARSLRIDSGKALPASEAQRQKVAEFMKVFAETQDKPDFYQVLDIARRIAGTGSLGVERYVILVEGKGSPDGCYLIDLKQAKPSSLAAALSSFKLKQPEMSDEAVRVVTVQRRMQAVDHAFLQAVQMNGAAFVLKGLQPSEDRLDLGSWGRDAKSFAQVTTTMGRILAWDQLRAAGRQGAANADELVEFAQKPGWPDEILDAARAMRDTTRQQWQAFKTAYEAGRFVAQP